MIHSDPFEVPLLSARELAGVVPRETDGLQNVFKEDFDSFWRFATQASDGATLGAVALSPEAASAHFAASVL